MKIFILIILCLATLGKLDDFIESVADDNGSSFEVWRHLILLAGYILAIIFQSILL